MSPPPAAQFDAVVIGAGFSGIYMLHKLRNELGMTVRAFDKTTGIGGTWYKNRYPGATSDTESFVYRYAFETEMLHSWKWNTRYLTQPEILAYLEAVVNRYDLARDIQLSTAVTSAVYDESEDRWDVATDRGESITSRYLVCGLGLFSRTNIPDLPGKDSFQGTIAHTGAWPEGLQLEGQRVGVVGTGATGSQMICAAAPIAEHLTVFQRSAQYIVPSGNGPVTDEYLEKLRANYDAVWDLVRNSFTGFGFPESTVPAMSVSEQERQAVFEVAWQTGGGFRYMFATFSDIAFNPEANEAAASFIRSKIAEIVKDPEVARTLTPTEPYAKRPLCGMDYYESYNRDNVTLVSIKDNPITELTPNGVRTADGVEHELNVLVFATGFDAIDGEYRRIDIRGRDGVTINEHWQDGPTGYLGVATPDFPNLFMVLGPHSPFVNNPPAIETQVEWITDLIRDAEQTGPAIIEATHAAEDEWTALCFGMAHATLFPSVDSWIFGTNIPGKKRSVVFFLGGMRGYRAKLAQVRNDGYAGFELRSKLSNPG